MLKKKSIGQKRQGKVNRSRSRSISPLKSKGKNIPKNSKKNVKSIQNRGNQRSPLNPSLNKSQSKKGLNRSKSDKNIRKNASLPRLGSSKSHKNLPVKKQNVIQKNVISPNNQKKPNQKVHEKPHNNSVVNSMRTEQKDMGLLFIKPEHDKIIFKSLQITDQVFEKYLEMINNDNDTSYVMNALPQLKNCKKEDETEGRDFVSGRISRLSGLFQNLTVDKIITPIKKVPHYYQGHSGKNIHFMRIVLLTKFKVEVDLGFLQYSLDGDKLTVFRAYISKIYRRMNYVGFVYIEMFKMLMQKHPGADRWSMFILERNVPVHKFFKFLGFHIDKIATESKNKTVDYFQQFTIKKKDLQTVISSMSK